MEIAFFRQEQLESVVDLLHEMSSFASSLSTFTRPVTDVYLWCPPVRNGRIDLRAIGL
jgi:hypothetical protein